MLVNADLPRVELVLHVSYLPFPAHNSPTDRCACQQQHRRWKRVDCQVSKRVGSKKSGKAPPEANTELAGLYSVNGGEEEDGTVLAQVTAAPHSS